MTSTTLRGRLEAKIVRAIIRSPKWLMRAICGPAIIRDGQTLDLQVQFLLHLFKRKDGPPTVQMARQELEAMGGLLAHPATSNITIASLELTGPTGAIPARSYRPRNMREPAAALVYYHGGGYVAGSLDSHDMHCRQIALDANCLVISVDYRLAPEHPFPAAIDDGVAAFRQVTIRAGELGVDVTRVAVGGDSAGGNLAAVVAQQTKDDINKPCFQLLWIPWVDMSRQRPSYTLFERGFGLERIHMEWFTELYLPRISDSLDPRASPILGDVAGLAPAAILIAGFDPLRDEGEEYARKLEAAGIDAFCKRYPSLPHSFLGAGGYIHDAAVSFDDATRQLREAFARDDATPSNVLRFNQANAGGQSQ